MPRGVASIDPQDCPLPLPLLFPAAASRARSPPPPPPRYFTPPSPPFFPAASFPSLPSPLPLSRVPRRRPGHPSWFTSLFTVSLAHFPAFLAHTGSHTIVDFSLPAMRTPPSSPRRHHPDGGADVTSSFDRGRCLELESRRVGRIRRTFADPGARSLGSPSNGDQSHAAGNEREAIANRTSASSQKIALNFCGDPIFNLAFIEIKYIGEYTLGSYFLFVSSIEMEMLFISLDNFLSFVPSFAKYQLSLYMNLT